MKFCEICDDSAIYCETPWHWPKEKTMDEKMQQLQAKANRLEDENRILRFEIEKLEAHKQKYEGTDRARLLTRVHKLERLLADALIEVSEAREAKTASAA